MLYIFNVAFREGNQNLGLGSAVSVLTIILILIMLSPFIRGVFQEARAAMTARRPPRAPRRHRPRPRRAALRPAPARIRREAGRFWLLTGPVPDRRLLRHAEPVPLDGDGGHQADRRRLRRPAAVRLRPRRQAFVDLWQTTYFYQYLINTADPRGDQHRRRARDRPARRPTPCRGSRARSSAVLLVLALIFRALPRFAVVLPMYEITQALGIYDTTFALAIALVAINQPFSHLAAAQLLRRDPGHPGRGGDDRRLHPVPDPAQGDHPADGAGILTAGIFVFLFAFQEYLTALVLTDVDSKTVPVFIATQLGQTLPMLQQAGAATMLLTLPVMRSRSSPRSIWWRG